jgi:hypothetical protein
MDTRIQSVSFNQPVLLMALDAFFRNPTLAVVENLYNVLNSLNVNLPILTAAEKKIARIVLNNRIDHYDAGFAAVLPRLEFFDPLDNKFALLDYPSETEVITPYMDLRLPIKLPLFNFNSEIGSVSSSN